jgi:hypothetical protein
MQSFEATYVNLKLSNKQKRLKRIIRAANLPDAQFKFNQWAFSEKRLKGLEFKAITIQLVKTDVHPASLDLLAKQFQRNKPVPKPVQAAA